MLSGDDPTLHRFFRAEPQFDEACHSFSYETVKDGLRLLVTIFDLEGAVYVSIFREGLQDALFTVRRELCTHVQIRGDIGSSDCFEAGAPSDPVSDSGMTPMLVRGVRVYLDPHFRVELIGEHVGG